MSKQVEESSRPSVELQSPLLSRTKRKVSSTSSTHNPRHGPPACNIQDSETERLIDSSQDSKNYDLSHSNHNLPSKDYESLDYDICYNVPYKEHLRGYSKWTYLHLQVMHWVLVGIIGFLTGVVAFLINICVGYLFELKFNQFEKIYSDTLDDGSIILGFLVLLGFNVFFAIIAALLIFAVPEASGSGIPEIKCYLNGVKVPNITRIATLFSKAVGALFAVAAGFFVGKEGPMIHSGAIIGAGIPQFRSIVVRFINIPYPYFRSDRYKRDFVSSGAAAGVAAAFGAPIGGVLFSLEGGASFWNQVLTWRTLFCSFCATFSLNFFMSISRGSRIGHIQLGSPGLVNFGTFGSDEGTLWNAYHLFIFLLMGVAGGLLGALFNSLSISLSKYRMKYLYRRRRLWRILESVLIAMVTTMSVYFMATFLGTCVRENTLTDSIDCPGFGDSTFKNETRNYFCPPSGTDTFFNDMATLMFNSPEVAIRQLFHQDGAFTLPTLWILFVTYFFIACWTHETSISGGVFIPCLLIGATYGRFVAIVFGYLNHWKPQLFGFLINLYPGTYTVIGAASFLGGVVRMTISLTVILIESTNELSLGVPILLSVLVAKWVGDLFNDGLYHRYIELKNTPFLGWESPEQMDALIAADVMNSTDLRYVYPITRVGSVERLLRTTAHGAFLVVTPMDYKEVFQRKKNIPDSHIPRLYKRNSRIDLHKSSTRVHCPLDGDIKEEDESGSSSHSESYSLPEQSFSGRSKMGLKSPSYTDERDRRESREGDKDSQVLMFHGIILRPQLVEMLKNKIFFDENQGPESQESMSYTTLTKDYPRYPSVFECSPTEQERNMLMDVSDYMNPCPYTISHEAPLPQVFNLFRTMGLRHLPVLREQGIVVGIITRHDLTHEKLHEKRHKKKLKADILKKQTRDSASD